MPKRVDSLFPCRKRGRTSGGLAIRGKGSTTKHISGKTWDVYIYILTSGEPVGVRDVWRTLKLSSPSLAQYHVNKLMDLKVIHQMNDGKYVAKEKEQIETLRSFVLLRGKLVPRLVFYGALVAGVLAFYLLFKPNAWEYRDLVVIVISIFSILSFFFEAFVQYRGLKVAVRKV
ncbi:MAG: hypothetical protein ACLFU9_07505 [Candidatus Bathyarchaeia archaeon]